jgi:hypothetical protein
MRSYTIQGGVILWIVRRFEVFPNKISKTGFVSALCFQTHFYIASQSRLGVSSFTLSKSYVVFYKHILHVCYMFHTSHTPSLITLITFSEGHKLWNSSFLKCLQPPVLSSVICPSILFRHPKSVLRMGGQVSYLYAIIQFRPHSLALLSRAGNSS